MMLEIFSPRPVRVTTPTMMPAVAVVAATASTARPPVSSAVTRRDGRSAVSRRSSRTAGSEPATPRKSRAYCMKLRTKASIVARNTARNGVMPDTRNTTMAMRGTNW